MDLSGSKARASELEMSPSSCIVTFEEDCVRVVASEPENVTLEDKQVNAAAFALCWQHISMNPSHNFQFLMLGSPAAPKYELQMEYSLVEKLPLLHDVATNADPTDDAAPMHMVSSIWGLVSLLILLDGEVTVQQWFEGGSRGHPIASLPGQTLEVACYLDCSPVKNDVVAWLQRVMAQLVEGYSGAANKSIDTQMCSKIWELTEVMRWVMILAPEPMIHDVMSSLTADSSASAVVNKAAHLPQDLLCRWLKTLTPVVDLRECRLRGNELTKVVACISTTPGKDVTELHLPALGHHAAEKPIVTFNDELNSCGITKEELVNLPIATYDFCCGLYHRNNGYTCAPTHLSVGAKCPECGLLTAVVKSEAYSDSQGPFWRGHNGAVVPLNTNRSGIKILLNFAANSNNMLHEVSVCCVACQQSLQVPALTHFIYGRACPTHGCNYFTPAVQFNHPPLPGVQSVTTKAPDPCVNNIATIGCLATSMESLQHLGLQGVTLSQGAVLNLGQLLGSLPPSVTKLTLSILCKDASVSTRVLLFKAIARMRSLRELRMPQWEEVVGEDAVECVLPLKSLPHLHVVMVTEVTNSNDFSPEICFQAISDD